MHRHSAGYLSYTGRDFRYYLSAKNYQTEKCVNTSGCQEEAFSMLVTQEILVVVSPKAEALLEGRAAQEPLEQQVQQDGAPSRHEAGAHHHHGGVKCKRFHGLVLGAGAVDWNKRE